MLSIVLVKFLYLLGIPYPATDSTATYASRDIGRGRQDWIAGTETPMQQACSVRFNGQPCALNYLQQGSCIPKPCTWLVESQP